MIYTIILQHTTTKQYWVYNLDDLSSNLSIYYKFNISLDEDMPEGEYQYVLFENPSAFPVVVDVNHIMPFEETSSILVTYDNTLTDNTCILIAGKQIEISSTGLIRIGDYSSNKCTYDKQQTYVSYERK